MQLELVEPRRKPGPSERSECGIDGCTNQRELTAQGYEKPHCQSHRPRRYRGRQPQRYPIANRKPCLNPECHRLSELKWTRRGRSERPFCDRCRKDLAPHVKQQLRAGPGAPRHPSSAGRRYVNADGYVEVSLGRGRSQAEHRLVMERVLRRPLLPGEQVHHINGDRADNRPENLQLRRTHGSGQAYCCADCGSENVVAVPLAEAS